MLIIHIRLYAFWITKTIYKRFLKHFANLNHLLFWKRFTLHISSEKRCKSSHVVLSRECIMTFHSIGQRRITDIFKTILSCLCMCHVKNQNSSSYWNVCSAYWLFVRFLYGILQMTKDIHYKNMVFCTIYKKSRIITYISTNHMWQNN